MNVAEKIEPEKDNFGENLHKLLQANSCSDYEPAFNNVIGINDWVKIKEDQGIRDPKLDWKDSKFLMQKPMLQFKKAMQIFSLKCLPTKL